ncbi:MAG: M20/M25/M40 family metallo-hydrolase [Thermoanaerobaculia bacterium]
MDNLRDYIVELTKRMVRERTVNYNPADFPEGSGPDGMKSPGEEYKVVNILKEELQKAKIPYKIYAKDEKRPNIMAYVGKNLPGYKKLLVVLHTDTVPSGVREDWSFDPFEPFEKNGKLFGRGVLDNKGPLASSFATLLKLKERENEIKGQFIFGAFADEEVEAGYGFDWVLDQNLIECTDALIPDIAGSMKTINIAEKGRVLFRVKFKGLSAHAMDPSKGVSAIYCASNFLNKLQYFNFSYKEHPVLTPPTFNPGLIKGGEAPNAVPAYCEVAVDVRYLPGMDLEVMKGELEGVIKDTILPGASYTIEMEGNLPPSEVKADSPMVKIIKEFVPDAEIVGSGGITFAKFLVLKGIEAVGWAPGDEATYHKPDEEISVDELCTFSEYLEKLSLKVCNMES